MPGDWPQELRKPVVLGNFRERGKGKKHKNSDRMDKRQGMSKKHAELIRKMPCCICLKMPGGDIHHLKITAERGVGMKARDKWGVPMCRLHHDEMENVGSAKEAAWFSDHGIEDPYALAISLWISTGELSKMIAILMAHRGE